MSGAGQPPRAVAEFKAELVQSPEGYMAPYREPSVINEILVDGIANASAAGGLLRAVLFVERSDMEDGGKQVRPIVCRLAMTPIAAALIRDTLNAMLLQMVAAGAIPEMPLVEAK